MTTFKWLPRPLLSLTLLIIWLLLFKTLNPGHILLGALLGLLLPLLTAPFWPEPTRISSLGLLFKFILRVLGDIIVANWVVARLILNPRHRFRPTGEPGSRSRFVQLPLDLEDELALTILASTISLTPGTVSSDLSADRQHLLIHCLDTEDENTVISQIKERYEAPLKEIFEC